MAARQLPQVFDECPVLVHLQGTLAGQAGAHVAHLAAAHGVGLAGEGEGAAARTANGAGGQVQVAQRVGVPGAVGTLVEAHGPAAHPVPGFADPLGGLADIRFGQPGDGGDALRRVVREELRHGLPAAGMGGDEGRVGMAIPVQQMKQAVEQGEVGARPDRQVEAGLVGGSGAARVDHDQLRPGLDPVHHAQEENRVAVGHVGAGHQEEVGLVEILVGAGRPVGTEGELVATAGAGHAQPRVGFDVAGADEPLGQFVGQILGLQGHLPGHIEGNGIRTVGVEQLAQAPGSVVDGLVDAAAHRVAAALVAQVGVLHAARVGQRLGAGVALGAEAAEVGRVGLVAAHLDHTVVRHLHDDAAADTAIRTHASHCLVRHIHYLAQKRKSAMPPTVETGETRRLCRGVRQSALIAPGRAIARHMPSPANTRQGIVRRTLQVFFEGPNGDAGELQDGAIDPPSHRFGS
ncbi:hypothetical protein D9M72_306210 [compost metagenome]